VTARPVGRRYTAALPGGEVLGPLEAVDVTAAYFEAQRRWPHAARDLGVAPGAAGKVLLQGTLFGRAVGADE
jgi:hypothetical protein